MTLVRVSSMPNCVVELACLSSRRSNMSDRWLKCWIVSVLARSGASCPWIAAMSITSSSPLVNEGFGAVIEVR